MALSPRLLKSNKSGRTIYYTGLGDGYSWTDLNNWSTVSHISNIPITSLPGVDDTVIVNGYLDASSYDPIIKILIQNGGSNIANFSITVLQYAIFNSDVTNHILINGDAIFNDYSSNSSEINGNATFNDNSINNGSISLNATFNDGSTNVVYVVGNATFNNDAVHGETANVDGTATFNNASCSCGGTATVFIPNPPPSCQYC